MPSFLIQRNLQLRARNLSSEIKVDSAARRRNLVTEKQKSSFGCLTIGQNEARERIDVDAMVYCFD